MLPSFLLLVGIVLQIFTYVRLGECYHAMKRMSANTGCIMDAAIMVARDFQSSSRATVKPVATGMEEAGV